MDLLLHKRMEPCSGRKPLLMEKELDSIVILITTARLSPSDTLLARMGSESWKELTFPPELLVKSRLLLLPRPLHLLLLSRSLHLSVRQPLFNSQLTMTMLIHRWILTSTHSSTPMTPLTVTSSSTEMEPTLDPTMPTT